MIATARRCGAAFMVVLAAALVFMAAPPAYSEDTKAYSGQAPDGSAQISVSVTYESAASGSDGGGGGVTASTQTVTATVRPTCYHEPMWTGKSLADDVRNHSMVFGLLGASRTVPAPCFPSAWTTGVRPARSLD